MALKLHFTKDSYNVFETRGNVKGTEQTFLARSDRFLFDRIARTYITDKDVIQFFASNFAYGNDAAVYDMDEARNNYVEWQKRKQSLTRVFNDDLSKILFQIEKNRIDSKNAFQFVSGTYPLILKMFIGKQLTIESMFLLNKLVGYLDLWDNSSMILWEDDARRIRKCDGFVKFEPEKLSQFYEHFKSELKELSHG